MFLTIDAGKPIRWNPEQHNFEEWPKSQVFIFHTKNPLDFDYPDCFGTLLTPSLVLTIASCFKEVIDIKKISIVKVKSYLYQKTRLKRLTRY